MATIALAPLKVRGFYGYPGVQPEVRQSAEAATQTFKAGDFLEDNGSGYLQAANADNDPDIVGVAAIDGQNGASAGDKTSQFYAMVPGLLMEANLYTNDDGDHVLAQTDLYTAVMWQHTGANSYVTLNHNVTTPRVFIVQIGLDTNRGLVGDTNARVYGVPTGSLCAITPDA